LIDTGFNAAGIKKTCGYRLSMDRWEYKECKKKSQIIAFWNVFRKIGPGV
jgi:hypothetical protein